MGTKQERKADGKAESKAADYATALHDVSNVVGASSGSVTQAVLLDVKHPEARCAVLARALVAEQNMDRMLIGEYWENATKDSNAGLMSHGYQNQAECVGNGFMGIPLSLLRDQTGKALKQEDVRALKACPVPYGDGKTFTLKLAPYGQRKGWQTPTVENMLNLFNDCRRAYRAANGITTQKRGSGTPAGGGASGPAPELPGPGEAAPTGNLADNGAPAPTNDLPDAETPELVASIPTDQLVAELVERITSGQLEWEPLETLTTAILNWKAVVAETMLDEGLITKEEAAIHGVEVKDKADDKEAAPVAAAA